MWVSSGCSIWYLRLIFFVSLGGMFNSQSIELSVVWRVAFPAFTTDDSLDADCLGILISGS